jgi:type IV pilus assembly protein PilW
MAITGVVMAGIFSAYMSQKKAYEVQGEVAAVQQNLRAGMYYLERELRMAGYDPAGTANAGFTDIATSTSIAFTKDSDGSALVEPGTAEEVRFEFRENALKMKLGETGAGAVWQTVASNIDVAASGFTPLNATGGTPASGADVRMVDITMRATDGGHTRVLTSRVMCRNMGL